MQKARSWSRPSARRDAGGHGYAVTHTRSIPMVSGLQTVSVTLSRGVSAAGAAAALIVTATVVVAWSTRPGQVQVDALTAVALAH